jgi:GH15 family glucan-1,4-alpha-glucosidase
MADRPRYPPIGDYAFLSDCNSAALVSSGGSVDWACLRRFDANSVLGRLLDWDRGGFFAISPVGQASSTRRYLEGTLVLETELAAAGGRARIRDAFAMHDEGERRPRNQLLRVIEGTDGEVELDVCLEPRFDFGELRPLIRSHEHGRLHTVVGGDTALVVNSTHPLELDVDGVRLTARIRVSAGEVVCYSVEAQLPHELDPQPQSTSAMAARMDETVEWWQEWSSTTVPAEPYGEHVRHSAAVLKGLTCGPTGALVAAPTTSLPEEIGGERNWDYRFTWIRDATLVIAALEVAGHDAAARGFRDFLLRAAGGSAHDLRIMYGIDGSRYLPEHELGLEGYRGSAPVRIGNGAFDQLQHDMYGQILDAAHLWHTTHHELADHEWRFLRDVADRAAEVWDTPDQGIWEMRCGPRHFVHSKALLWVAMDRAVRFVEEAGFDGDADRWRKVGDRIREQVDEHGVRGGHFTQAFDTDEVDAALLELPMVGFVAGGDERMMATVDRIMEDLAVPPQGFIKRYRTDHVDDGMSGGEGTFLMCTFWLVDVLAMQGRFDEATGLFDRLLEVSNDLGLYSEQHDAETGELLGNFPQAFTHLGVINSAHHLACAIRNDRRCRESPWTTAERVDDRGLQPSS